MQTAFLGVCAKVSKAEDNNFGFSINEAVSTLKGHQVKILSMSHGYSRF